MALAQNRSVKKRDFLFRTMGAMAASAWLAPAHADVLEVGARGARWVAGGPAVATGPATPASYNPASYNPTVSTGVGTGQNSAIPPRWQGEVARLSARYDLSPAIIAALIHQESGWHEGARSPRGARGLTQLMPATARALGADPDDPAANIAAGAHYLRQLIDRFNGDIEKALAAYNAGPGRVAAAGGVPHIAETRQYVAAILEHLAAESRRQ